MFLTYVHVQRLAIASVSADRRGHNNQLVLRNEIANAALFAGRFVAWVSLNVEFQRCDQGQDKGEEELEDEEHIDVSRPVAAV